MISLLKIQYMYTYKLVISNSMIYLMLKGWEVFAYVKDVHTQKFPRTDFF